MDLSNENVIHQKKNGIEYLQFRRLLDYQDKIEHAYTLGLNWDFRTGINQIAEEGREKYKRNLASYQKLCDTLKLDYTNIVRPVQKHTNRVKVVEKKIRKNKPDFDLKEYQNTDGLITNQQDILLGTINADCILLLFYDPVKDVIANTHSGWKGTLQRISVKTVEKMVAEFECNPKDIICCLCPSIHKCHFEVEKDVKDLFEKEFQDLDRQKFIEEKILNQKWNIDTIYLNQELLQRVGLQKDNIIDSKICSVCHADQIHSYRIEKTQYGLNLALIGKR